MIKMGLTLTEIAKNLRNTRKKVRLIYAFNGTGKTRLSRKFQEVIATEKNEEQENTKILYYNAFTEDLFYWENDTTEPKLKIQPNWFTSWILIEEGQDGNIVSNFQHYVSPTITPRFSPDFSELTFAIERGNAEKIENIKISKGEESNLIWCVFYSLLEQVIEVLNVADPEERSTDKFNALEYIFIDDPVSSLDDTHLIELAVNIATLIKSSQSELQFIITTHNPLFYNILSNEFGRNLQKYRLLKLEDGTYELPVQSNDSPFSYHLFLLSELDKVIASRDIQKYHFNFLRNILEKTSTFFGHEHWRELLPNESREAYYNRIINLSSHSKHHGEEVSVVHDNEKKVLEYLVGEIKKIYLLKPDINQKVDKENDTT